jgi:hypothetical protein
MSADVSIGNRHFNYTHNTSALWYDHIPDYGNGGGLREIHELTGSKALLILTMCFDRLDQTRHSLWSNGVVGEPAFCAKYDAKNGWGSTVGAIIFLAQIMAACASHPDHEVDVSL